MRTARILDRLFGEEEGFCGCWEGCAGGGRGERGGGVFEEEDYAVDRGEGGEGRGVEGEELFELDAGYAEVVEEEGEDSGVGFDCRGGGGEVSFVVLVVTLRARWVLCVLAWTATRKGGDSLLVFQPPLIFANFPVLCLICVQALDVKAQKITILKVLLLSFVWIRELR